MFELRARLTIPEKPNEIPVMHENWRNLLFLHWKYDANEIQKTLPPGLFVDTFKGDAYLTINAFFIENLTLAHLPSIPGLSNFIEVTLRTYVYDKEGVPGIWFYSLDLNSFIGCEAARITFSLPYHLAQFRQEKVDNSFAIQGKRVDTPQAMMSFSYRSAEETFHEATASSLDFFLIERYLSFSSVSNQLYQGQIYHKPYAFAKADVSRWDNNLFEVSSFNRSNRPPDSAHYCPSLDVEVFKLKKL